MGMPVMSRRRYEIMELVTLVFECGGSHSNLLGSSQRLCTSQGRIIQSEPLSVSAEVNPRFS